MTPKSLLIPVWKTRDYTLDMSRLKGEYFFYLRRSGFYYAKNAAGIKVKLGAHNQEDADFLISAYSDKRPVSLFTLTAIAYPV